jgi:hypothetical protein
MSDTSILPNATPATDAGIDMVPPGTDVDESSSGDRRRLMILGGVAAVVVVAAAGFMLLHKGSSSTPTATGPVPRAVVPAAPTQAPAGGSHQSATGGSAGGHSSTSTPSGPSSLPKVAKHTTARDPFHPLVTDPLTTSGGATSTTTVNAPTTTDGQTATTTGSTPTTAPTDGSTGTTTGTGTTGTTSVAATPLWIQLMNVHGRMATFDVGYAHHKFRRFHVQSPLAGVHQATVFDKIFALVSIHGGQVSLQIGDDAPFQLVTGIAHTVGG